MFTGTGYMPRLCVNSVSRVSVVILIPIQATFKHWHVRSMLSSTWILQFFAWFTSHEDESTLMCHRWSRLYQFWDNWVGYLSPCNSAVDTHVHWHWSAWIYINRNMLGHTLDVDAVTVNSLDQDRGNITAPTYIYSTVHVLHYICTISYTKSIRKYSLWWWFLTTIRLKSHQKPLNRTRRQGILYKHRSCIMAELLLVNSLLSALSGRRNTMRLQIMTWKYSKNCVFSNFLGYQIK